MNRWENKSIEEDAAACQERIVITILFVSFGVFVDSPCPVFPFYFFLCFFFFFRAPESQLCTKSERSEWMEGDCDLFVRHIQHRKRKGREGNSTKSRKNRRGECGPEVYGNTLPVITAFVWLNARTWVWENSR